MLPRNAKEARRFPRAETSNDRLDHFTNSPNKETLDQKEGKAVTLQDTQTVASLLLDFKAF